LLYTLYSVPNVVLPFFGGVLVDRFGARRMLVLFSFTILVGQAVFALGSTMSNFNLMLVRLALAMKLPYSGLTKTVRLLT
jgi:MFS family permease